jgi:hypothetical protein
MINHRLLAALALGSFVALAAAPLACGSSGNSNNAGGDDGGTPGVDGSNSNTDGATTDDGGATGDDAAFVPKCGAEQAACSGNSDCCSNLCLGNHCVSSISTCGAAGANCGVSTDCCTGACIKGTCGSAQCVSIGDACPAGGTNACCTDTCVNGKCAAIGSTADGGTGGACLTAGNKCAHDGDCCSGLCTNGTCNKASSFCLQNGEMCFTGSDCCGGTCSAPNGQPVSQTNPGLCGTPGGAVNCTAVDGVICAGTTPGCPGPCCSDLCVPFGPTGVLICQPAQGCRVEGDLCEKNSDCCGGEDGDAGLPGAQLVVCTIAQGAKIGVCSTPSAGNGGGSTCRPPGDVCHYNGAGYNCSVSASSADCCDIGGHPNKDLCQLDKLGVPRCLVFGGGADGGTDGGANACRQSGQTCATASDCCNNLPCVPGAGGQLTCATTSCIPSSGPCTSNADCCAGITCVIPVGSPSGTCAPSSPPPGTDGGTSGGDGGTADGGTTGGSCGEYGQSCASLPCCTGLACIGGSCGVVK